VNSKQRDSYLGKWGKKKAFTCQNTSCKKDFTAPLKTLNLRENPSEPYFACPYCLTKIKVVEEEPLKSEEPMVEKLLHKAGQIETKEKGKNDDKSSSCHYHPGYLSERSSKEQIPDECLVCKDIVDCMLKKMHE
jgi:hypothetical protein